MRIMLLILMFLLLPIMLSGAEIHGFVEIGKEIAHNRFYTDMEMRFEFNIYSLENTIYGGNQIWAVWKKPFTGAPFLDIYRIGYKAQIDRYYLRIEHSCGHPVLSQQNKVWWNTQRQLGQNFTEMTFGVEW